MEDISTRNQDIASSFAMFASIFGDNTGIWIWETESDAFYFNDMYMTMLGHHPQDFPHHIDTWKNLLHPDDRLGLWAKFQHIVAAPADSETLTDLFRMRNAQGAYQWIQSKSFVITRNEQGVAIRLSGAHVDVETMRSLQTMFSANNDRMRFALETAQDGLWEWNPLSGEVYYSPRYITMCGYTPETFPQTIESWKKRVHPEDLAKVLQELEHARLGQAFDTFECIYRFLAADGTYRWMLGRGRVMRRGASGLSLSVVGLHTDITELHQVQERLSYHVNHDSLTNVHSRFYFDSVLQRLENTSVPVSIIYADVDGLKLINDALGHSVGDKLLQRAAHIMQLSTRLNDTVARVGGDEFSIILENCTEAHATRVLNTIRESLRQYNSDIDAMPIFLSLGLSSTEQHCSVAQVVIAADELMLKEKLEHRPAHQAIIRNWIQTYLGEDHRIDVC